MNAEKLRIGLKVATSNIPNATVYSINVISGSEAFLSYMSGRETIPYGWKDCKGIKPATKEQLVNSGYVL